MSTDKQITTRDTIQVLIAEQKKVFAKKAEIPTKVSVLENDSKFQTENQVNSAIKAAVAGSLQPAGSVTFANLPELTADNLNKIVNVTDKFTTTDSFVEGSGHKYPAGTNVAIINVGSAEAPSYKYDAYTGVVDTSGFMSKVSGGAEDNILLQGADGEAKPSGKKLSDFVAADPEDDVLRESDISDFSAEEIAALLADDE